MSESVREATWEKAWRYGIQPLITLIGSIAIWWVTSTVARMDTSLSKQAELISDINGKVNYGVIQRIESLERSKNDLEIRVRTLEIDREASR